MNESNHITSKNQAHPQDQSLRRIFLEGVMQEASVQGYGVKDQGRLFVVALRAFEGR